MEIETTSDYGSDFTPDEEEILRSLVQQAPAAALTEDRGLVLKDIEDHEGPRGARVPIYPRHQQQQFGGSQIIRQKQTPQVALQAADDIKLSASGEPHHVHKQKQC